MKGKIMKDDIDWDEIIKGSEKGLLEEMQREKLNIAKNTKNLREATDPSDIELAFVSIRLCPYKNLDQDCMDAVKEGFKNKNNDRSSFKAGYSAIEKIVCSSPELAKQGQDIVVCSLLSENQRKDSLKDAQLCLNTVEHENPKLERLSEKVIDRKTDADGRFYYTVNKKELNQVTSVKTMLLRNAISGKTDTK